MDKKWIKTDVKVGGKRETATEIRFQCRQLNRYKGLKYDKITSQVLPGLEFLLPRLFKNDPLEAISLRGLLVKRMRL